VLEQSLNVTRLKSMVPRNEIDGQIAPAEVFDDIRLDNAEPRGATTTAFGDRGRIPSGPDCERHEIVDVWHNSPTQLRRRKHILLLQRIEIGCQQPQRLRVAPDGTHKRALDVCHERGERGTWDVQGNKLS